MAKKKTNILNKRLIDGFDAQDAIAALFIIGGFILMALKVDTIVGGLLTLVAGFYFGKKAGGADE